MVIFALLFLAGAIYNYFSGNYADVILGLVLSITLLLSRYIWGIFSTNEDSKNTATIFAVVMVLVTGFIVIYILKNIEITPENYVHIAKIKSEYPSLKKQIQESIKDNKISFMEYDDIRKEYRKINRDEAIRYIKI